jgi:hypothetical protein
MTNMNDKIKMLKLENLELHASDPHHNCFNIKRFFEQKYQCESSSFSFDDYFELSLLEYCFEHFEFIYHSGFTLKIDGVNPDINYKNILNFIDVKKKPNFYFLKNDSVIILSLTDKNEKENLFDGSDDDYSYHSPERYVAGSDGCDKKEQCSKTINNINSKINVTVHYPSFNFLKNFDKSFLFLKKYKIKNEKRNFVSILMKDQYNEYDFIPLDINVPQIDISMNYGKSFVDVYDKTLKKLKNNDKGLYMFHGEPGTGKSSFVKHLTSVVDKEFIFVPTTFVEKFISDPDIFSILVRKKKCILILEDAEKVLISREKQDNEYISTILNLSDGILSDMIQASIIITYNCEETKIDKALKRKGRTMIDYKFDKLSIEDSKKLAKHLNFNEKQINSITESMSLSQIYNINDENKLYFEEEKSDRIVGFGKI